MIYAIGDLHLSFARDKTMEIFGYGWKNHTQRLEEGWRRVVAEEDLVIVPGDISWAIKAEEAQVDLLWVSKLPGTKLLIKGNHDYWWSTTTKARSIMPPKMNVLLSDVYYWGDVAIVGIRGWTCPGDYSFNYKKDYYIYKKESERLERLLTRVAKSNPKKIIVAMHFPPFNHRKEPSGFTRSMMAAGVNLCVYGHLHDTALKYVFDGWLDGVQYLCVSSDKLGFKPSRCDFSVPKPIHQTFSL